jgi:membrane associated rhomboid family serine protease
MSDQPIPYQVFSPRLERRRWRPVGTQVILAVTFLVFLLMTVADFISHPPLGAFLLRTFTGASQDPELLIRFGASYGPYIRRGEYFRLVMPMFLHVGMLHLLLNAYALYILGRILERMYGYGRFALIYVLCGIGSVLLSMTLTPSVAAGASGAIFGISGTMLVAGFLHREAVPPLWRRAFGRGILPFILVNLIFGFTIKAILPIDNWAHVGGLLTGILLGALVPPPKTEEKEWLEPEARPPFQYSVVVPALVVLAAMGWTARYVRTFSEVTRLLEHGEKLQGQHETAQAQSLYEQAGRVAPLDERPHEKLASLYLDENRLSDTVREANVALKLSPDSTAAEVCLVAAYKRLGDQAHVKAILKEMEDALPPGADGQAALADLFVRQKLYAEAIAHYESALKLKPDFAGAQNNLAWLLATCDDPAFRNPARALELSKQAVELTKWKEPTLIDTLAEALYANQHYPQAVEIEAKALELSPDDQEFRDHMERYRKAAAGSRM